MALVSLSSKCFNAVEAALKAVKTGDARRSTGILKSIKEDGLLLQQQSSVLYDELSKAEKDYQRRVEDLTRQITELHKEERQLENSKRALGTKKSSLADKKQSYQRSKEHASTRYKVAEHEKREAEEKYDNFKYFFWVPIVGWILALRELIEDNKERARDAYRDMMRYERDINSAETEIRWANSEISQVRVSQFYVMCST